jgi:hypothetical protein
MYLRRGKELFLLVTAYPILTLKVAMCLLVTLQLRAFPFLYTCYAIIRYNP